MAATYLNDYEIGGRGWSKISEIGYDDCGGVMEAGSRSRIHVMGWSKT